MLLGEMEQLMCRERQVANAVANIPDGDLATRAPNGLKVQHTLLSSFPLGAYLMASHPRLRDHLPARNFVFARQFVLIYSIQRTTACDMTEQQTYRKSVQMYSLTIRAC